MAYSPFRPGRAPGAEAAAEAPIAGPGEQRLGGEAPQRPASRWRRTVSWWGARPTLAAAVLYAVLAVLLVGPGLVPGRTLSSSDDLWSFTPWSSLQRPPGVRTLGSNFELLDSTVQHQPFLRYSRSRLPDMPLWNPYVMGGRPYLANAQSAIFSPFTAIGFVLPFWRALAVMAALKLFVGALGMYLLGRTLGMRFGGGLFAGLVYAFGTGFVVWLAWPLSNVFPFIPFALLLTELIVRRAGALPAAGLAGVVALQFFGGHPETSFHLMFTLVMFFAFRVLLKWRTERESARPLLRSTAAFGAGMIGGTALAAVTLVPFVELLGRSGDVTRRLGVAPGSQPGKYIGALFLHDYWGRPTQAVLEPFMNNRPFYAGAITLMLVAAALILRPTATRVAVLAYGGFTVLMYAGVDPVFSLVTKLPGFRVAHNSRMVVFLLVGLALLAGWGLDDLTGRKPRDRLRRRLVVGAAAGILCVPVVWMLAAGSLAPGRLGSALDVAWGFAEPPPAGLGSQTAAASAQIIRLSALLQWLPLAAAGLTLIALRLRPARPLTVVAFIGLTAAVLAVDLFRANMGYNPAIPIAHASTPDTGAIRYLQSRRPARFVGLNTKSFEQPLPVDLAMDHGLYDARGYDYPVDRRYDRLWRRFVAPPIGDYIPPTELARATPASLRALSLLSVRDVLQATAERPLRGEGLRLAYEGRDARIYANPNALPRVMVVGAQRTVSGEAAALAAVTSADFAGRRVAVTERRLPDLPQGGAGSSRAGRARLVSYQPERVVAEASARRASLLVLTDTYYPGWRAKVDGRSAPVERVDYMLRGVPVPPGRHRVELSYEPGTFRAGALISGASLVALVVLALVGYRRRRTPAPAGARR